MKWWPSELLLRRERVAAEAAPETRNPVIEAGQFAEGGDRSGTCVRPQVPSIATSGDKNARDMEAPTLEITNDEQQVRAWATAGRWFQNSDSWSKMSRNSYLTSNNNNNNNKKKRQAENVESRQKLTNQKSKFK